MKHIIAMALFVVCSLLFLSAEASVENKQSFFDSFNFLTDMEDSQIKSIEIIPGDEDPYRINFLMKFRRPVEPIGFWGSDNDGSDIFSLDGIAIIGRHDAADSEFRLVLDMRIIGVDKTPLKLYIGYDDEKNARYRVEEIIIKKIDNNPGSWEVEKTGEAYLPYGE